MAWLSVRGLALWDGMVGQYIRLKAPGGFPISVSGLRSTEVDMSQTAPSIKGVFMQGVVADVAALVARGAIAPATLEARLSEADRKILAGSVVAALWYPSDAWCRMIELLRDVEGGAEPRRYLIQRGVKAAQRVIGLGVFKSQIEAFQGARLARIGGLIATLSANIFNFGKWRFADAEGETPPRIEITEATLFPRSAEPIFEGFVEALVVDAMHLPLRVRSIRPTPDTLVFEMLAPA